MCAKIIFYSPRQKSWPVIHKFNEKSYKHWQKCLVLVDMYRGHKQCWYLVIPPSWIMTSWTLVGMLIFISLPDIGFLNLFWLRVLAVWKPGPSLSWFLTVLRGTLALHSSTAALLSSFLRFFLTCSFPLHWLRKCKRFTFTWMAAKLKVFVLEQWNFIPNSSIQSFFSETLFQKSIYYRKKVI